MLMIVCIGSGRIKPGEASAKLVSASHVSSPIGSWDFMKDNQITGSIAYYPRHYDQTIYGPGGVGISSFSSGTWSLNKNLLAECSGSGTCHNFRIIGGSPDGNSLTIESGGIIYHLIRHTTF
jgi:hypothetical protein